MIEQVTECKASRRECDCWPLDEIPGFRGKTLTRYVGTASTSRCVID